MTQDLHIARVRRMTLASRIQAMLNVDSMVLFNSFYCLFGFILTGSFLKAAFMSFGPHKEYLDTFFGSATLSTVIWGIAYAAWTDKLRWAWNTLTVTTTLGLIGGIFVLLFIPGQSNPAFLHQLIFYTGASPGFWALTMGLRKLTR